LAEALEQLQTRNRELAESQEQQTATAEILRIISNSPTDVQPVLEAVAENAARLCESFDSSIFRRDGDRLLLVAHHGPIPFGRVGEFAIPLTQGSLVGRSILEHRAVQVTDLQTETEEFPLGAATACQFGYRTSLAVPLLRESAEIGAISIRRTEVRRFTERQVALLQTFADQAVIAIENVRLFNETKEALEQQTATADILRVISQAQTDLHQVFETIADSAMHLLRAWSASVWRYEDDLIRLVAARGGLPGSGEAFMEQRRAPRHPADDSPASQTVLTRTVFHSADVETDPTWGTPFRAEAKLRGFRSIVVGADATRRRRRWCHRGD
jgi:GAF domain-containing protein